MPAVHGNREALHTEHLATAPGAYMQLPPATQIRGDAGGGIVPAGTLAPQHALPPVQIVEHGQVVQEIAGVYA